jgi:hypothetical protein
MFQGSVRSTGYPFHSPVSPSLPLPCVTVCHHISTGLYIWFAAVSGFVHTGQQTRTERLSNQNAITGTLLRDTYHIHLFGIAAIDL